MAAMHQWWFLRLRCTKSPLITASHWLQQRKEGMRWWGNSSFNPRRDYSKSIIEAWALLLRCWTKGVALAWAQECLAVCPGKQNQKIKNLPEWTFIALVQKKERRKSCLGGYKSTVMCFCTRERKLDNNLPCLRALRVEKESQLDKQIQYVVDTSQKHVCLRTIDIILLLLLWKKKQPKTAV